jgi:cell division transport system ATP-binding protein
MRDNAPALEFRDVSMRYQEGRAVMHRVNFLLERGTFTYIRGTSGAGKSTLLKLAYHGLEPTAGHILVFGEDLRRLPRARLPQFRRNIGVVYQDFRLLGHLTALQNVAMPLHVAGIKSTQLRADVKELLEWVGLSDKAGQLPATLSGGEKQRLAIARAVITKPKLLLADEPTGNVDDKMAMKLMYLFEELHKMGTTILMVTHNDGLVERFPHPQLMLEDGDVHPL